MKTEVSIEDVIADFFFSDNAITLKNIRSKINDDPDSDEVILNIDSPGGYVDIAWAIHDYLRTIDKPITAKINGMCASAATIIALAADKIEMTQNSKFMIHLPWTYTAGNSDELSEVVENLKVEENKIARLYADVTGRNIRAMMKLMKQAEFWDAEKAKDEGFVDVVKATNRKKKADQNRAMAIATLSGMSKEMKVAACINHQNVNIMSKERVNSKRTGMLAKIAKVLDGEPEVVDLFLSLADGREMEVVTNGEKPSVGDEVRINNRPAEKMESTLRPMVILSP